MALLSVAEALALVLADAVALPAEATALVDACGRVLAGDLVALRTQPPADVSAMDGYAVRAADVAAAPVHLAVVGEVAAGRPFDREIGPGEAARIFTGGVMPRGANGRRLTARDIALAGAMNHATVPVHRRPRMAVLATGDELVAPGTPPAPGQIVSSNSFALMAIGNREGAETLDLGVAPDHLDATVAAVRRGRAAGADVLVTTGGASVGDYDFVRRAFASEGIALSFWQVAMQPGKPLMHGRLGGMSVLGLPGNPVSSFVCATLFLVPLLRQLAGRQDISQPAARGVLGRALPANGTRAQYMRATLATAPDGTAVATPFPEQDSSLQVTLARADCLVVREALAPAAEPGAPCDIITLQF